MKPPCEVVVKRVLPAIRAMLVEDLAQRHELNQTEIAERLGITQPAVSQYLSSSRGTGGVGGILKEKGLDKDLREFSDLIASRDASRSQIIKKYCELCSSMGRDEILCALHAKTAPYLEEEGCDICLKPGGIRI